MVCLECNKLKMGKKMMKKIISFLTIAIIITLFIQCKNETVSTNIDTKDLTFQFCPNYFISNKFEDGDHYLILKDDSTFTNIFHAYSFPPDTAPKILESDFENYIVLAIVKPKNHFNYNRSVERITLNDSEIKIYYSFTIKDSVTNYERYGIITKIEKCDYNKIEFYENEKLVHTLVK